MKKPIRILSTDWHLKESNLERIKDLVTQKCKLAVKLGVNTLTGLGDFLDSRKAQTQDVLNTFGEILGIIEGYGLNLEAIPGNHDKTDYSSSSSFLDPFIHHPALKLIKELKCLESEGVDLIFIPFFTDEIFSEQLNQLNEFALKENKPILFTHMAFEGSVNNDGTKVSCSIKPSMFSSFFKVFSGHYHNQQKIGKNIYHIPSIQQNNFGEDDQKGFTVLYDDGSHELIQADFPRYKKVKIDLTSTSKKEVDALAKKYAESSDNIRFEFIGDQSLTSSIKKENFTKLGISVTTKVTEIEDQLEDDEPEEVKIFNKSDIEGEFKEFCSVNELKYEKGVVYLKEKLDERN